MISGKNFILDQTLDEYFSTAISVQIQDLSPPASDHVVHYLTSVLTRFSRSQDFFVLEENLNQLPTLALLYHEAASARTHEKRNTILRQLGDSALFIGALFFEHFSKKGINKDYFIGMGGSAYGALGSYNYGNSEMFFDLSHRFPKFLEAVSKACSHRFHYDADDIFSLLERWQSSNSDTLRKQLHSLGITPIQLSRKH